MKKVDEYLKKSEFPEVREKKKQMMNESTKIS